MKMKTDKISEGWANLKIEKFIKKVRIKKEEVKKFKEFLSQKRGEQEEEEKKSFLI